MAEYAGPAPRIHQKKATLWKTPNYLFILAVALVSNTRYNEAYKECSRFGWLRSCHGVVFADRQKEHETHGHQSGTDEYRDESSL
jgi:hypothetical protein